MSNDNTKAAALAIAERYLIKMGWRHSLEDIGTNAAKLIAAMDAELRRAALREEKGNGDG